MSELLSDRCCWLQCCFRTILQFQTSGLLDYLVILYNLRGQQMNNQPLIRSSQVWSCDVCCPSHMTFCCSFLNKEWAGSSSWSDQFWSCRIKLLLGWHIHHLHPLQLWTVSPFRVYYFIVVSKTQNNLRHQSVLHSLFGERSLRHWICCRIIVPSIASSISSSSKMKVVTTLSGFNEPFCDRCWVLDDWTMLTLLSLSLMKTVKTVFKVYDVLFSFSYQQIIYWHS